MWLTGRTLDFVLDSEFGSWAHKTKEKNPHDHRNIQLYFQRVLKRWKNFMNSVCL